MQFLTTNTSVEVKLMPSVIS